MSESENPDPRNYYLKVIRDMGQEFDFKINSLHEKHRKHLRQVAFLASTAIGVLTVVFIFFIMSRN